MTNLFLAAILLTIKWIHCSRRLLGFREVPEGVIQLKGRCLQLHSSKRKADTGQSSQTGVQYLFMEQPDISVSPLLQLMTDSTHIGTNGLRKHFMVRGELSTVILAEISEGHKYKPGFIKYNWNPPSSNNISFPLSWESFRMTEHFTSLCFVPWDFLSLTPPFLFSSPGV